MIYSAPFEVKLISNAVIPNQGPQRAPMLRAPGEPDQSPLSGLRSSHTDSAPDNPQQARFARGANARVRNWQRNGLR